MFVGLEHIESGSGRRTGSLELDLERLTGRKPRFCERDIVYGYLRPYLNKVWVAEFDGLCSVDQYVYQVVDGVDQEFIAWFIRSPAYLDRAPITATPGQLPRIRTEEVADVWIDLPPLDEQRSIAAFLTEQMAAVERARAATVFQEETTEILMPRFLQQVFESVDATRWPQVRVGNIADTSSGTTPSRGNSDYFSGRIPWVKTGELRDGLVYDTEEHVSETALRETSLKLLPMGTLLIAMYGQGQTRGRTGLLMTPATTNQACFAILPAEEKFDSRYLQWWFRFSYSRLRQESESRGGNQPNLNGELLRDQIVPLPPIDEQRRIADDLLQKEQVVLRTGQGIASRLDAIDALPTALLRRAFSGEM